MTRAGITRLGPDTAYEGEGRWSCTLTRKRLEGPELTIVAVLP
jgi:hypothetical protein